MLRKILVYGAIAGVIVGVPLSAVTIASRDNLSGGWGMAVGYLIMLVGLSMVFLAIKRHRDVDGGGVIKFWPAFGLGLGISGIAGIFYVLAWEAAQAVTHMDFASDYARAVIAQAAANGSSGAELAKVTADMAAFKLQYANPLYRLPMTFAEIFPVGVLVSLVSAGLLRNSRFMPVPHH